MTRLRILCWGAWAIDTGVDKSPHAHQFAGPYALEPGVRRPRPWQLGFSVGAFKTRTAARKELSRIKKQGCPKAKIVRVALSMKWAENNDADRPR